VPRAEMEVHTCGFVDSVCESKRERESERAREGRVPSKPSS
jgi:hypothetical protein